MERHMTEKEAIEFILLIVRRVWKRGSLDLRAGTENTGAFALEAVGESNRVCKFELVCRVRYGFVRREPGSILVADGCPP